MHRTDLEGVKISSSVSKMRKLCIIEGPVDVKHSLITSNSKEELATESVPKGEIQAKKISVTCSV